MASNEDLPSIVLLHEFAKKLISKGYMRTYTAEKVNEILKTFERLSKEEMTAFLTSITPELKNEFKKVYYQYIRGGYNTYANIPKYEIKRLTHNLRQELDNSIINSLGYIKTQTQETINELTRIFRSWATIPSPDLRGHNEREALTIFKREVMGDKPFKPSTPHQRFIVKDQSRKLLGNLNRIVAEKAGAFAFIWHNQDDKRVVGNPSGFYPIGTVGHNDHWKREGVLYLIKNSWAIGKGYIKKTSNIIYGEDIPDGMPSIPYNCRCYAEYIFRLSEIPPDFQFILTNKGKDYIKG